MSEEQLNKAFEDIKSYNSSVDEALVKAIIKHLGIALRSRDGSLVSCSDADELKRMREGFMKKKLALTASDEELDQALKEICTQMSVSRAKSRITFCYLLTEKFSKQSVFA
ncbi:MAG: DUF2853 family protein [Methylococcaceae bacterium]